MPGSEKARRPSRALSASKTDGERDARFLDAARFLRGLSGGGTARARFDDAECAGTLVIWMCEARDNFLGQGGGEPDAFGNFFSSWRALQFLGTAGRNC